MPEDVKELSLQESILLAIRNNITIKTAYLDRVVEKFDLKIAEEKFIPRLLLTPSLVRSAATFNGSKTTSTNAAVGAFVTQELPTGGTLSLTYDDAFARIEDDVRRHGNKGDWNIKLAQPLLKGAGYDVATASMQVARLNEQISAESLKTTLIETVTTLISVYRTYQGALKQVEIDRRSLDRARELVAVNRELIAAGRMAALELVQTEADVAAKEFDLLGAENSADAARLALVGLLDIDRRTMIVPTEEIVAESIDLDYDRLSEIAFHNRPDYLTSLLGLENSEINLLLAENNKLWDLALVANYGEGQEKGKAYGGDSDSRNWAGGLTLTIPFRDLSTRQGVLNARIARDKGLLNHKKLRDNIEIEIKDAVRNVEMSLRQVRLAERSRSLSEQKLSIEVDKMRAGRSSNFQLVTFQNDLINAQTNELDAVVSYLNALTGLERATGMTLRRWGIEIERRYENDYRR